MPRARARNPGLAAAWSFVAREVPPRPTAASARRSEDDSAAAVVGSDRILCTHSGAECWDGKFEGEAAVVVVLHNKKPPTPCLWQAPASTEGEEAMRVVRVTAVWRLVTPLLV